MHCISKNVPRVVGCNSCQSLTDMPNSFTARKHMKFAVRNVQSFLLQLECLIMLLHHLGNSNVQICYTKVHKIPVDQNEVVAARWPQMWSSGRGVALSKSRTVLHAHCSGCC